MLGSSKDMPWLVKITGLNLKETRRTVQVRMLLTFTQPISRLVVGDYFNGTKFKWW